MHVCVLSHLSRVRLFVTPWTAAHQIPLFMGFLKQEYWSGLPFPSQGIFFDPGIERGSPILQADSLLSEPPGKPSLAQHNANKPSMAWCDQQFLSSSCWTAVHEWMCPCLLMCSQTERRSGCFQFLEIKNEVAINIDIQAFVQAFFSHLLFVFSVS